VRQQMQREVRRGIVDAHGVRPIGTWVRDGVIYCIVVAPDETAVCEHHADRGLRCDDLHPIEALSEQQAVDAAVRDRIQDVIAQLWTTESERRN
jgi:hypothetical protein